MQQRIQKKQSNNTSSGCSLVHKVSDSDNKLGIGKTIPGIISESALQKPDLYAVEKELYLGSLCQVSDKTNPWSFPPDGNAQKRKLGHKIWSLPLKRPEDPTFQSTRKIPLLWLWLYEPTGAEPREDRAFERDGHTMMGWFNGTYELEADLGNGLDGISYYEVLWEKRVGVGGWEFKHKLKTSSKYPWRMLYLRADATRGFSGGYHYDTRGMLKTLPESPNFKARLTLCIKQGGGPMSQFYLLLKKQRTDIYNDDSIKLPWLIF
ncbi:hypothetical protein V5N11_035601 [Cardamine amara subsp. amara]|uniref:DUF7705 domain-containing protein n=1 Tax=Cardamine amara subsp. amara TaxID=228776 RepID=A0ABD1BW60_CARAN